MAKRLRDELEGMGAAQRARRRMRAVTEAAEGGPRLIRTRHGTVHIHELTATEDGSRSMVEVRLAGQTASGETHFRVVNPPTLVEDPAGDIVVRDRAYREDPLAALAEVVAMYGGARAGSGRKRRRI